MLKQLCESIGVHTSPQKMGGVWIVPVCSWYHFSWDREPSLDQLVNLPLDTQPSIAWDLAGDRILCKWPEVGKDGQSLEFGSEAFAQFVDDELNTMFGILPLRGGLTRDLGLGANRPPIISFSHFLPRQELLPEKRFLFHPNLAGIVGSDYVRKRVEEELESDVHVFGHTHFEWDVHLHHLHGPSRPRAGDPEAASQHNGQTPSLGRRRVTRYRSWPLGNPREQAERRAWLNGEEIERWWPVLVFDSRSGEGIGGAESSSRAGASGCACDSEGKGLQRNCPTSASLYPKHEVCFFSRLYEEGHVVRGSLPAHLPDYTAVMYCAAAPRLDWDALCKQVDRHWKDQHPRAAGRVGGVVHSEQKH